MSDDLIRPFRWDVSRVSELGSLARTEVPPTYPTFEADLRVCAARTIASAGDSDLIFVGRSPEPLFHLISGVLAETTWSDRLDLFNVSLRGEGMSDDDAARIEPYLEDLGLSPARRERSRGSFGSSD